MRLLLVLDQLGNVVFFNGSQDETISSHIGRTGRPKVLVDLVLYKDVIRLPQNNRT